MSGDPRHGALGGFRRALRGQEACTTPGEGAHAGGSTEGNERLTGLTGALLLMLLAAEGVTILFLRPLLSEHMFIGVLLIPPVVLKLASTGYRFVRYYTGSPPYRLKGPPALAMRVLAPFLVVATLTVLGTGVALIVTDSHDRGELLFAHKVSFVMWLVLAGAHVLAYSLRLPRLVRADPQTATIPLARSWERGRRERGIEHEGSLSVPVIGSHRLATLHRLRSQLPHADSGAVG